VRLRSILFAPGNSERKLRGALAGEADAVIADLEDSVPLAEKAHARAIVAGLLSGPRLGPARFVRVNGAASGLLDDDLAALEGLDLDGIVLPKATPDLTGFPLPQPVVAIVETASGMARAGDLAAAPGVRALLLGAVDLALELRLRPRADGAELAFYRSTLVLASAVASIAAPIDVVHLDVRDAAGLEEQALLARDLGMGGKACIHPAQVAVVNAAFAPAASELEAAHRIVEAYDAAVGAGSGAVALEGRMIDRPVYEQARRLLAENG
jgi:citrate lyase subunit beta / citryl-CoA lyase